MIRALFPTVLIFTSSIARKATRRSSIPRPTVRSWRRQVKGSAPHEYGLPICFLMTLCAFSRA